MATDPALRDHRPVLVGFDGSEEAALALRWAADLAQVEGLSVRVVVARGDLHSVSAFADDWTAGLAQEWAERARTVLSAYPGVEHEIIIMDGRTAPVLVDESRSASHLVVGARGHGAVEGMLLGSVSHHVVRHAACPVVVVRPRRDELTHLVVVGVDGSAASLRALSFALGYAEARGLMVRVGHCDDHLSGYEDPRTSLTRPWLVPDLAEHVRDRVAHIDEDIREVLARHRDVPTEVMSWRGRPPRALVQESRNAALVVVGARGLGGFAELMLGSVSSEVLHWARCPVAVVR